MIPPISADCSKPPSECRRHNIGLRGGWAHLYPYMSIEVTPLCCHPDAPPPFS
jgi:hypothetical protein